MEELPISIQIGIKEGFKELPQRILWKFESDETMIDQPKNVFTRKWFPQYDVISKLSIFFCNRCLLVSVY